MTGGPAATVRAQLRRFAWPLRIGVLAGLIGLVAWKVDVEALRDALHPSSWGFLVAAVAANGLSVAFKGLAWKGVVDGLPAVTARTRLRDLVSPLFVGFLFNTVLAARLGEVVKVMLAKRRLAARDQHVSTPVLFGSVVAENLVTSVAWVAVVVAIGLFLPLSRAIWLTAMVIGIVCLAILLVAMFRAPRRHAPKWLSTGPLWRRARHGFHRLWVAVHESHVGLRSPKRVVLVGVPAVASWCAQLVGIRCALEAFGLGRVGWSGAGLLLVTVSVAQIFPVLPGNLGVFQAAVVVPLTNAYPVSSPNALAFALGLHATEIVVGVAIGFAFLMVEGVSFRQMRDEAERESSEPETTTAAGV